jgi:pimeloyl-ACP methyl ester carboxylesterase
MKLIILIILFSINFASLKKVLETPLELINSAGFIGEEHEVVTEDGYKLKVHRVLPQNLNEIDKNSTKAPILLQHGLLGSSKSFLLHNNSLAFYLAENGFDVWLGNVRGNFFGLEHEKLETNSSEFWSFSFNEIGFYDLPAIIDKMLSVTGSEKLFYVGHSQGKKKIFEKFF